MAFTYFFRDIETIKEAVALARPLVKKSLCVWNAGCASGQEPYSIAIALAEALSLQEFNRVEIIATDIDISNRFAKIIKEGLYPRSDLARLPADIFKKYFIEQDNSPDSQIIPDLRNKVKYLRHNLLTENAVGQDFTLVISKNTLMHFTPLERRTTIKMFHANMQVGAVLALGQVQDLPLVIEDLFERVSKTNLVFVKR